MFRVSLISYMIWQGCGLAVRVWVAEVNTSPFWLPISGRLFPLIGNNNACAHRVLHKEFCLPQHQSNTIVHFCRNKVGCWKQANLPDYKVNRRVARHSARAVTELDRTKKSCRTTISGAPCRSTRRYSKSMDRY